MQSTLSQILAEELTVIARRRQVLGTRQVEMAAPPEAIDVPADPVNMSLVGIALCGPGERAANFSIGLLDAFHSSGFLRHVDYLSTTGGGSCAAARLIAQACESVRQLPPDSLDASFTGGPNPSSVDAERQLSPGFPPSTRQPVVAASDPVEWLNRSVFNLLVNGILFLLGVVSVCATIALLWRCLDLLRLATMKSPDLDPVLTEAVTIPRAFLPCLVFALVWFYLWFVSLTRRFRGIQHASGGPTSVFLTRTLPHSTRFLLLLSLVAFLVGLAITLGNADQRDTLFSTESLGWSLVAVLIFCLLPWLRPHRLLMRGQWPRNAFDSIVFRIASFALLVGIPLVLVYLLGRENLVGADFEVGVDHELALWREDQEVRLMILVMSLFSFLLFAFTINLNFTSMFDFYRQQLAIAYGVRTDLEFTEMARIVDRQGFPFPLFGTTLNWPGDDTHICTTYPYVVSPLCCGSTVTGYAPTSAIASDEFSLDNVMALSGAGSPLPTPQNGLLFALMLISNLHLGRWLPNPCKLPTPKEHAPAVWRRLLATFRGPTALRLLLDYFRKPKRRSFQFVSDGDDDRSLALIPLLQRRCALIVFADMTADLSYEFADFARLVRRLRLQDDIRFVDLKEETPLQLASLRIDPNTGLCHRHFFAVGIRYPDHSSGTLIYLKPSLTGDEELDVRQYAREYPAFPQEESTNRVRPLEQLESYRQLGHHMGTQLFTGLGDDLWTRQDLSASDLASWLTGREGTLSRAEPSVQSVVQQEVAEQLERIIQGPRLENYVGYLCACFTDSQGNKLPVSSKGVQHAKPGQTCRLVVWLQIEPPGPGQASQEVAIRDGRDVKDEQKINFEVALDSDRLILSGGQQNLRVSPKIASRQLRFKFKAPDADDICPVWVQLFQKNRLIQVVELALDVSASAEIEPEGRL